MKKLIGVGVVAVFGGGGAWRCCLKRKLMIGFEGYVADIDIE